MQHMLHLQHAWQRDCSIRCPSSAFAVHFQSTCSALTAQWKRECSRFKYLNERAAFMLRQRECSMLISILKCGCSALILNIWRLHSRCHWQCGCSYSCNCAAHGSVVSAIAAHALPHGSVVAAIAANALLILSTPLRKWWSYDHGIPW